MNCPNCLQPIDGEMQACKKCGAAMTSSCEKPSLLRRVLRSLDHVPSWVVVVAILLILLSSIHGHPTGVMLKANMCTVEARGKDIYVSITAANTERVSLGLSSIWPKTYLMGTNELNDISSKVFTTSTEYFKALYDEKNSGTDGWKPYVKGFGYSKLAGVLVPCCIPGHPLTATNNMWIIVANITEQDDERIPVLLTRNVDVKEIERVVNMGLKKDEFEKRITFSGIYKTPFSKKGFVVVSKDGITLSVRASQTKTLGELFDNKELPPRDPSKPPIVYLMP
jgi:hypothetical protein